MTVFLRLLADKDKATVLQQASSALRQGYPERRIVEVSPEAFKVVPGAPFSYWIGTGIRDTFRNFHPFEGEGRTVKIGMKTGNDFRFLRIWWESHGPYVPYAKGGAVESFYGDLQACVNWRSGGSEVKEFVSSRMRQMFGNENYEFWISNESFYFLPGITWSLRGAQFSPRAMVAKAIFSVRGYCAFVLPEDELASLALMNSSAFDYIFKCALGRFNFPEFIVGILQKLPWSLAGGPSKARLTSLARRAWSLKRTLDTIEETSHAFLLPALLRSRLAGYDPPQIEAELTRIQAEIDEIAFDLYGFEEADRTEINQAARAGGDAGDVDAETDGDEAEIGAPADSQSALISWCVGVAFGRFDCRLATGRREAPSEPGPFDLLPTKSPGMLPDGVEPFHAHAGILVDDRGHPQDLNHLVGEVLERIAVPAPEGMVHWLQREFFAFHLQRYSNSHRKAPIYWPVSTASGGYTLWLYYPTLTDQTLYVTANDFVGPKLEETSRLAGPLRTRTDRSRDEERQLEKLQDLEGELKELQDELLRLAPTWKPNHDDGVQITAAPLWRLFRHRPWQSVLKETWEKLEKGEYDWAHLAMAYWPDRVREKCRIDKSLAIAHDLEDLYEPPPVKPATGRRGRKRAVEVV